MLRGPVGIPPKSVGDNYLTVRLQDPTHLCDGVTPQIRVDDVICDVDHRHNIERSVLPGYAIGAYSHLKETRGGISLSEAIDGDLGDVASGDPKPTIEEV